MKKYCHSFSSEFQNILAEIRSTYNSLQSVSPTVSNSSVLDAWILYCPICSRYMYHCAIGEVWMCGNRNTCRKIKYIRFIVNVEWDHVFLSAWTQILFQFTESERICSSLISNRLRSTCRKLNHQVHYAIYNEIKFSTDLLWMAGSEGICAIWSPVTATCDGDGDRRRQRWRQSQLQVHLESSGARRGYQGGGSWRRGRGPERAATKN